MLSAAILQIHSQILFLQPLGGGGVTHPKQEEVSLSVCPAGRDMFLSMFLLFYVAVSPDVLVYGPRDL